MPMSSPMMNRMLGFLSCAKMLLAEKVAISAIATASNDVNGDLAEFIESNFDEVCLKKILDLSPTTLRVSCLRPSRTHFFSLGAKILRVPSRHPFPSVPSLLPTRPIHPSSSPHPGTSQRFRGSRWQVSFRRGVVGTPGTPWVHRHRLGSEPGPGKCSTFSPFSGPLLPCQPEDFVAFASARPSSA